MASPRPAGKLGFMSQLDTRTQSADPAERGLQTPPASRETVERWLVVGLDGRAHDADALALAQWLRSALGGQLLLAHVCPPAPPGRGMDIFEAHELVKGRHLLSRTRRKLRVSSESALLEPMPADAGLSSLARERGAELLVLGSSHRGAVGRIVPGGVASQLLSHAPCAIAVAPVGIATRELGAPARIGVAYDTTGASDVALRAAADAAQRLGASLSLYHAFHPVPEGDAWAEFRGHLEQFAQSILECGLKQLPPEIKATARVLEGHAAEAVSHAADADGVDLLYVGSRGYGPLREAVLGGVAGGLLHTSRVPLVIVPRSLGGGADHAD